MNRRVEALIRWRVPLLVLVLATVVPAARLLPQKTTDNTIETFLAEGDPGIAFYRETKERFGGDDHIYVAARATGQDRVFSPGFLRRLRASVRALEAVEGVQRVTALTSTDAVRGDTGSVEIGPLIKELPENKEEISKLRRHVVGSPTLSRLVSADRRTTLLLLELTVKATEDPTLQNRVVKAARAAMVAAKGGVRTFALAGNPTVAEAIERHTTSQQQTYGGLMMIIVGLGSFVLLRRWSAALLPGLVVGVTTAWTMGLFVGSGHRTNWVTDVVPLILVLVSVADTIHLLSRFQTEWVDGRSRREAMKAALRRVFVPCLVTSLTTAAGFTSLMVNQVLPMRTFGLFAALGVVLALLSTLLLVPTILSLRDAPGPQTTPGDQRPNRLLSRLDNLVQARPRTILMVGVLACAALAAGIPRIRVETDLLRYFHRDTRIAQDVRQVSEAFGGSSPLALVFDSGKEGGALEPKVLRAVDRIQTELAQMPDVERGVSLADLVRELYRTFSGQDLRLPDSRAAVSQLLLLVDDPDILEPLLDADRRRLRLASHFDGMSLGVLQSRGLLRRIRARAEALVPAGVTVRLTGASPLFVNMDRYVVDGQIRSLGIILVVLTLLMVVLFRSARLGLMAMIPNVAPIAAVLGFMGWVDLPLDGFTAMIASIAIGIGVDDTIHYLHHLRGELSQGKAMPEAVRATTLGVGRALVVTSAVLALGFWVFCLSQFVAARNFGLLTGLTVVLALAADLLLLPAILLLLPGSTTSPAGPKKG